MKKKTVTNWFKRGLKAFMATMLVSSAMAIDFPVDLHVYDSGGTPVPEIGVDMVRSFGISSSTDEMAPPPNPGSATTSLWFRRVVGTAGEQSLKKDFEVDDTMVTWKLRAALLPVDGYKLGGFDTTAYSSSSRLTIEGPGITGAKDITGDFTDSADYFTIENGDYTITYLKLPSDGVTVSMQSSDGGLVPGSQWWLLSDSGATYNSGHKLVGLAQGNYTLVFSDVTNYTTPANQSFEITDTAAKVFAATYMRKKNTVTANYSFNSTAPADLTTTTWQLFDKANAGYYTFNNKQDFESGVVITGVPTGNYRIEYSDIDGAGNAWTPPDNVDVTVSETEGPSLMGEYNLIPSTIITNFNDVTIKVGDTVGLIYTMTAAPVGAVTIPVGLGAGVTLSATEVVFDDQTPANYPMSKVITVTGDSVASPSSNSTPTVADDNEPRFTEVINVNIDVISASLDSGNLMLANVTEIDFGTVVTGETVTRYIQVRNDGSDILGGLKAIIIGAGDFEVDSTPVGLAADGYKVFPVQFSSNDLGTQTVDIRIMESTTARFDVTVTANVIAAAPIANSALFYFDPAVVIANPEGATANTLDVTYSLMIDHSADVAGNVKFTVPDTVTAVTAGGTLSGTTVTVPVNITGSGEEVLVSEITMTVNTTAEAVDNIVFDLSAVTAPTNKAATNSQLIISTQVQLGNLDVDGDGIIYDASAFSYDTDDILIIFNYISAKSFGDTDQSIIANGTLANGLDRTSFASGITNETILKNIQSLISAGDSGLLDVDGDGVIYDASAFSYDTDDILIIFNYISAKSFGDTDQSIITNGTLANGLDRANFEPGITDQVILNNILKFIKIN